MMLCAGAVDPERVSKAGCVCVGERRRYPWGEDQLRRIKRETVCSASLRPAALPTWGASLWPLPLSRVPWGRTRSCVGADLSGRTTLLLASASNGAPRSSCHVTSVHGGLSSPLTGTDLSADRCVDHASTHTANLRPLCSSYSVVSDRSRAVFFFADSAVRGRGRTDAKRAARAEAWAETRRREAGSPCGRVVADGPRVRRKCVKHFLFFAS